MHITARPSLWIYLCFTFIHHGFDGSIFLEPIFLNLNVTYAYVHKLNA